MSERDERLDMQQPKSDGCQPSEAHRIVSGVTLLAANPTTYDFINLGIAVFAAVAAAVALTWQVVAWLLSGPRIKAEMRLGMLAPGGNVVTWPPEANESFADQLAQQGFIVPILAAQIRNKGRMPVTVTGVTVVYSNEIQLAGMDPLAGERLPYRLDAHAEFTFLAPLDRVMEGLQATLATGGTRSVRLNISLANGKTVQTDASDL